MTALLEHDILRLLPHRYPFLLVDRVLVLEPHVRIVALKNVSLNEPFFEGCLPGPPAGRLTMPGLLIVEAMAQAGGLLLMSALTDSAEKLVYFSTLHGVVWHATVHPGDQLHLEIRVTQQRGRLYKVQGVTTVDGRRVCEAQMGAVLVDRVPPLA